MFYFYRMIPNIEYLKKEISFKTSRSGGKGGQHVNKVASRVELNWNFQDSPLLTDAQKQMITQQTNLRLTHEGFIQIVCDEERSQFLNKEKALHKLTVFLQNVLKERKKRKATKPTGNSREKRLEDKRRQAEKKKNRKININ